MNFKRLALIVTGALVFAGPTIQTCCAQQAAVSTRATEITGLIGVKDNVEETLSVEGGNLHFVHGKASSDVSATSIEGLGTGTDSRKSVGQTVGMMSMAAPCGPGNSAC